MLSQCGQHAEELFHFLAEMVDSHKAPSAEEARWQFSKFPYQVHSSADVCCSVELSLLQEQMNHATNAELTVVN